MVVVVGDDGNTMVGTSPCTGSTTSYDPYLTKTNPITNAISDK